MSAWLGIDLKAVCYQNQLVLSAFDKLPLADFSQNQAMLLCSQSSVANHKERSQFICLREILVWL